MISPDQTMQHRVYDELVIALRLQCDVLQDQLTIATVEGITDLGINLDNLRDYVTQSDEALEMDFLGFYLPPERVLDLLDMGRPILKTVSETVTACEI